MELRQLRYFVAVAEELHFGRAAKRLHISQPPLSVQIRHLEEELGVALFSRKRRVELTPAGQEFLRYVYGSLQQLQQGVRSAQRVERGERGELNVGFISSMASTYMPWLLRVFRDRYPDVELVLNEDDTWTQFRGLTEGRLSVGIVRGPVNAPGLVATTVLTEPLIVALPATHPLARARRVAVKALADEAFVMVPRQIGALHDEILRLCTKAGFSPRVAQVALQLHIVVSLVSARVGVALVPASTQLLPIDGVVFRPLARSDASVQIAVVFRANDRSPVVREFVDVAREVFSGGLKGLRRYQ
jgi:DNA-binding transcriptional LysR family regulator